MAEFTIKIPDWFLWVFCIYCIITSITSILQMYYERKIYKLKAVGKKGNLE